jgi:hypothetical protein
LDTFYQLFLLQKEFENGSLIMMFPEDIHELISSYFHSSDADCLKDKYALIRAGQNAETLKKSLECLYKIKKPTDNNRYVFEQIFHEIFAGSSINAKLFRHKPDLFVELISILEQQYEHHVIAMLLKQVPYNTLKQDNIRTAIADGLKALSTEGNLNGILKKVNQQTVVSAREHASEVAKALILLNKNGLLNTKHRAVLLNYANNAINVAKQIIHQKARPLSLMFRPHGARKRNHVETPTAPSKRARPSK